MNALYAIIKNFLKFHIMRHDCHDYIGTTRDESENVHGNCNIHSAAISFAENTKVFKQSIIHYTNRPRNSMRLSLTFVILTLKMAIHAEY